MMKKKYIGTIAAFALSIVYSLPVMAAARVT